MGEQHTGFAYGGKERMRKAITAEVKLKYKGELLSAKGFFEKQAIYCEIEREVSERMKAFSSPYLLWSNR